MGSLSKASARGRRQRDLGSEIGIKTSVPRKNGQPDRGQPDRSCRSPGSWSKTTSTKSSATKSFGSGRRDLGPGVCPLREAENLIGGDGGERRKRRRRQRWRCNRDHQRQRNRERSSPQSGIFNKGLFIDLIAAGAELEAPTAGSNHRGSRPPKKRAPVERAEVGANVRVFRKQSAEAGELDSFLGEASADSEGEWEVVYDSAVPAGTVVAATQTSKAGGTSELATATTEVKRGVPKVVGEGSAPRVGSAGVGSSAGGLTKSAGESRPRTKIVGNPRGKSKERRTVRIQIRRARLGLPVQARPQAVRSLQIAEEIPGLETR